MSPLQARNFVSPDTLIGHQSDSSARKVGNPKKEVGNHVCLKMETSTHRSNLRQRGGVRRAAGVGGA